MVGDTVEKIGRTTGKTAGEVDMTCGTWSVIDREDGLEYVYLCTGAAFAGMQGGDSGSPVIWRNSQGQAFLVGLAFAGVDSGEQLFFNNWHWIDYELGSVTQDLDPHWYDDAPPPPCEPPDPC